MVYEKLEYCLNKKKDKIMKEMAFSGKLNRDSIS
jgi:hypothetical protein